LAYDDISWPFAKDLFAMRKFLVSTALCALSLASGVNAETLQVTNRSKGRPVTVALPEGAKMFVTAGDIEYLTDKVDSSKHKILLTGDVTIKVNDAIDPIVIEAQRVELTLSDIAETGAKHVRETRTQARNTNVESADVTVFSGDVSMVRSSEAGLIRITADKIVRTERHTRRDVRG
jgi:hypothetical protein